MAEFLNKAVKLVLVAGPKLRVGKAQKAFVELADACGYPIAVMPSGKRLVPEHHPHFFGTYWGVMCTSYCGEIVESADAYVFVGPIFNDYSSVGYSLLIKKETSVIVQPKRVTIGNGPLLDWIFMVDFLTALAKELKKNITANKNYRRIFVPPGIALERENNEPLRDNMLFKDVQKMLGGDTAVIAETGDSWFSGDTAAPSSCTLWVTAQDISMMIGCGHRSIIFLIDNGGYTIDVEIHDGPYNVIIKMWNYTGLVDAIHYGDGCYSQWGRQMLDYQGMCLVLVVRTLNNVYPELVLNWKIGLR